MKKKISLIAIIFSLLILNCCGFKKINKVGNNTFSINEISTSGDKTISYLVKNIISINAPSKSSNRLNIEIDFTKSKESKEKNISKKTTKYELRITANVKITEKNTLKVINKSFEKTITYQVDDSHSATLTNEKNSIEDLSEKIAEDIINFLYIYFEA